MGYLFFLLLIYGIAASLLFYWWEALRAFKPAQAAHVAIFALLSYLYLQGQAGMLQGSAGLGGAIGLVSIFVSYGLGCAANAVAFACIGAEYAAGLGRWLMSYHKVPELKSYDRAENAVSNRNFGRAAALYGQKIEEDPEDVEAHRRLAEVLLKMDRAEDAAGVFRRGLERAEKARDSCRIAFRLAEVLDEKLGRSGEAAELYRMLAEEYPDDRRADAARSRLEQMGPENEVRSSP